MSYFTEKAEKNTAFSHSQTKLPAPPAPQAAYTRTTPDQQPSCSETVSCVQRKTKSSCPLPSLAPLPCHMLTPSVVPCCYISTNSVLPSACKHVEALPLKNQKRLDSISPFTCCPFFCLLFSKIPFSASSSRSVEQPSGNKKFYQSYQWSPRNETQLSVS